MGNPAKRRKEGGISAPHPHDVLCGRGGASNNHEGNAIYRCLVEKVLKQYATCLKTHKRLVAKSVVEAIKVGQNPPGRFLEKDKKDGLWYETDLDAAIEKTKQSLRETRVFGSSDSSENSELTKADSDDAPFPARKGGVTGGTSKANIPGVTTKLDFTDKATEKAAGDEQHCEEQMALLRLGSEVEELKGERNSHGVAAAVEEEHTPPAKHHGQNTDEKPVPSSTSEEYVSPFNSPTDPQRRGYASRTCRQKAETREFAKKCVRPAPGAPADALGSICFNDVKSPEKIEEANSCQVKSTKYTILVGNTGSGKSTILNGFLGEARFKSGISFRKSLTTTMQLEMDSIGDFYGDTPGLSDIDTREQAAKEITKALRSGKGDYKLVFVVTLKGGRIRPEDSVTISLVLDALKKKRDVCYGILVNKVTEKMIALLQKDKQMHDTFLTHLNECCEYKTAYVHFYEQKEELLTTSNAVPPITPDLRQFLETLPSVHIKPRDVGDVKTNEYDAMYDAMVEKMEG